MVELKTDTKKIVVKGDTITAKKNIFGDKYADDEEIKAKINALYDMADILSKSTYSGKNIEKSYEDPTIPPKNTAHKNVKYWYKFKTSIIIDGQKYNVTFNIRDKGKEQYEYLIEFKKNQASLNNNTPNNGLLLTTKTLDKNNIPQSVPTVNKNFEKEEFSIDESSASKRISPNWPTSSATPASTPRGSISFPPARNTAALWRKCG